MFRLFLGAFAALPLLAAIGAATTGSSVETAGTHAASTCCDSCELGCTCCLETPCVCDACECGDDGCQGSTANCNLTAASGNRACCADTPTGLASEACCAVTATTVVAAADCDCGICDKGCGCCGESECTCAGCECPICAS